MTENVIDVVGLVKRFGDFTALDSLDLHVVQGEVHGFLGPNGAGKSTTIRVLLGLLKADGGQVRLLDGDPWTDVVRLHRRLAYVPGDVALWPAMTGGEAIDLLGRLRGGINETKRAHLLELFELDPTKRARTYSKGNRQKVALVAALASDVELLVLDEPTSGLDPLMEAAFKAEIRAAKAEGRTVLLSSHILSEIEALADRISIIRDGKVVETGTLDHIRGIRQARLSVTVKRPDDVAGEPVLQAISELTVDDHEVHLRVAHELLPEVMSALSRLGIVAIQSTEDSLEDIFLSHYSQTS